MIFRLVPAARILKGSYLMMVLGVAGGYLGGLLAALLEDGGLNALTTSQRGALFFTSNLGMVFCSLVFVGFPATRQRTSDLLASLPISTRAIWWRTLLALWLAGSLIFVLAGLVLGGVLYFSDEAHTWAPPSFWSIVIYVLSSLMGMALFVFWFFGIEAESAFKRFRPYHYPILLLWMFFLNALTAMALMVPQWVLPSLVVTVMVSFWWCLGRVPLTFNHLDSLKDQGKTPASRLGDALIIRAMPVWQYSMWMIQILGQKRFGALVFLMVPLFGIYVWGTSFMGGLSAEIQWMVVPLGAYMIFGTTVQWPLGMYAIDHLPLCRKRLFRGLVLSSIGVFVFGGLIAVSLRYVSGTTLVEYEEKEPGVWGIAMPLSFLRTVEGPGESLHSLPNGEVLAIQHKPYEDWLQTFAYAPHHIPKDASRAVVGHQLALALQAAYGTGPSGQVIADDWIEEKKQGYWLLNQKGQEVLNSYALERKRVVTAMDFFLIWMVLALYFPVSEAYFRFQSWAKTDRRKMGLMYGGFGFLMSIQLLAFALDLSHRLPVAFFQSRAEVWLQQRWQEQPWQVVLLWLLFLGVSVVLFRRTQNAFVDMSVAGKRMCAWYE
jgi:hypothetical protein